jgi:hypothetical protein
MAAEVGSGCGTSTYTDSPQRWTVVDARGQTVYGWAMIDPTVGQLRFVQRFDDADIQPLEDGGVARLLPTLTLTSAACGS